jgi:hypothetical protein
MANKYRLRVRPKNPFGTESFTRVETLHKIIEAEKMSCTAFPKKFDERLISKEHCEALLKCAKLWASLDRFETEVKNRPPVRKKTTSP